MQSNWEKSFTSVKTLWEAGDNKDIYHENKYVQMIFTRLEGGKYPEMKGDFDI